MVSLLEGFKAFFDSFSAKTQEDKAANYLTAINSINDSSGLTAFLAIIPAEILQMPAVTAAHEAAQKRVAENKDLGPFGSIPKALIDGFRDMSEPMQDLLVTVLTDALKPGSPRVTESIEGALDVLVDSVLKVSIPGDDTQRAEARAQIASTLTPILRLETTIGTAMCLAELIHPMKEIGLGNISHIFHDSFGFAKMTGSVIDPLSRASVGAPVEKAINRIFQPYLPNQGELTGLARKYEITEEAYRDAMRGYGVKEEYIDALLTGFWADPRLREILLLAQVERPDATAPASAQTWLRKAGLEEYIGPDWWFALKFAKAGYDRIDIPVLIKVVRSQFLIKELGDLRTVRRAQYKSGQLSRDAYETFLRGRGLREDELAPQLDAIEDEIKKDQRDETQKLYELQYKNGRITEDRLKTALSGLGLDKDRVASRVEYLTTQKLGKLTADTDNKVPTRADLEQSYKNGKMTKEAFIKRLDDMGYVLADAQLIADNAENDIILDITQEWQRAYEYRTRYGRMTAAELALMLVRLGKSESYADARSAYIAEVAAGKTGEVEVLPE